MKNIQYPWEIKEDDSLLFLEPSNMNSEVKDEIHNQKSMTRLLSFDSWMNNSIPEKEEIPNGRLSSVLVVKEL